MGKKDVIKFSVLLLVYKNDNPENFEEALKSIINQTLIANEIVIVCDGPLTNKLDGIIEKYSKRYDFISINRLKENQGHGNARRFGIEKCKNNLIALMDADDISVNYRFEKQIKIFKEKQDVSVVGGFINEFANSIDNIVGIREVPELDSDIKKYMKKRCPMNQVTVMFKKHDVIQSGNYIDWYCEEDYYLWIRMSEHGFKFYNIQENLVHVRVDNGMYGRRGGFKYFKSEKRVQKYMLKNKIISFPTYIVNVFIRFLGEVVLSDNLRSFIYKKILRRN